MDEKTTLKTVSKGSYRDKKIIIVIIVAILACIIATIGLHQILTPQRATVYLFNDDYDAGTLVTEEMLQPVEVDNSIVMKNKSISTSDYFVTEENYKNILSSAGVLRDDVYKGSAFMTSILTTTGGNNIEVTMAPNAIAITVGVNYVTAVTSELSPNSRVNVYASYDDSTTLLLENIKVLSVTSSSDSITSVTLEVNMSQSLYLIHAYTYGNIQLGIVDATGYQYSDVERPTYSIAGGFTY